MKKTRNIFLVGPVGAGKTTIGKQLADHFKLEFFDSDRELEERTGAAVDWIFELEGEEGFRKREEKIIDELSQKQGIVLATGGGAIVSKAVRNYLAARGTVVYLQVTVDEQMERTRLDRKRPLIQGPDKREQLEKMAKERDILYSEIADVTARTDTQSIRAVIKEISAAVES